MLSVLIVDDEPLARENLRHLLQSHEDINVIGEASNAIEAIGLIHRLQPDVVFLDIQMPRISGLEMVGMLDPIKMPHIVFLTAYDEYAISAFEANAFDYLLKPAETQRLEKTLQRLRHERRPQALHELPESEAPLKFIPCSGHSRIYLLRLEDVVSIGSRSSGVYVQSIDGKEYFTEMTLRTLESRTPFLRCHRQFLVNVDQLKEIQFEDAGGGEMVVSAGSTIPVSRRYLKAIKDSLGLRG